jgi:MFS family permease
MVNLRKSKVTAPTEKETGTKIFYGYVVVVASLLILVVLHGTYASYGVFLRPIQSDFGWDRATISGATSLAFFLMGLFSTVGGRLTDRYGPKLVMVLGGLILGVGYFLVSRVSMAWQLYLAYGVVVGIGTSTGDVTLMSTAARWFVKRRGLMTSIVKVGTGAGMFIMPLVASWLIVKYNWRTAFVVLGIVAAVVIVIAAQFLKRDPSQVGLQPDGIAVGNTSTRSLKDTDLTLREALRTRQFWMVCVAYFAIWYATQSVMVHVAAHSVDNGLSVEQSASIVSGIGGMSILGRLAMGGAGDRIGNRRALVICCAVLLTALIWLQFAQGLWMFYVFAAIYGFAHGGFFAVVSPLAAELFGIKSHGANLGMLLFLGQAGGALGPIVTGRIFDLQHSYHLAFLILIGAAASALALAALLGPVKLRKQPVSTESSF